MKQQPNHHLGNEENSLERAVLSSECSTRVNFQSSNSQKKDLSSESVTKREQKNKTVQAKPMRPMQIAQEVFGQDE